MKNRLMTAALALGLAATSSLGLAACSGGGEADDTTSPDGEEFTIGVAVIIDHASLQLIRDGFEDYLDEQAVRVTYKDANAQGEPSNAVTIATTFAADADLDLILAITTSIAQAMVQQVTEVPVVYAGVTNPAGSGLVPLNEGPSGTNVTGASDLNPEAKPVGLIQEIIPDVKTIGVLYSSSEDNSVDQLKSYQDEAAPLGITIKDTAVTNTNEIATAVATMTDVDAILIPTDNTVVTGIAQVIAFGESNKIPVFTADADSVASGTIASRGVNYYEQGREVGEMAYKILVEGQDPGTVPAIVTKQTQLKINTVAAEKMGVTIPDSLLTDAEIVTTEG
jgi:putative ABC transport system substrate-binding protein